MLIEGIIDPLRVKCQPFIGEAAKRLYIVGGTTEADKSIYAAFQVLGASVSGTIRLSL